MVGTYTLERTDRPGMDQITEVEAPVEEEDPSFTPFPDGSNQTEIVQPWKGFHYEFFRNM